MVQNTKSKVYTYALQTLADFNCRVVEDTFEGLHLIIGNTEVWTRFIGRFNAYNMLAVYATAQLLGVDKVDALRLLSNMDAVSGRFEVVRGKNNVTAIVDYAHTPDALQNVIDTINDIRNDQQRLITVVGCGGNRDKAKRPVMARIAIENSDTVVFTSDNPRDENPDAILDDMYAGLAVSERTKAIRIVDRKEAINAAVHLAHPGDIILIAGKGHETYQEIKGACTHFDDKEIIKELLIIHS
jgi:UDP-N-acetylmuramoyl-L-alanyl-D-glutamate--2,6-diaminopimelate ligase